MTGNMRLRLRMAEVGFTQAGLAEALNEWLRAAGHEGTATDRVVRYWLTGKTRWPYRRMRLALQAVFGCSMEELGFLQPPPASPSRTAEQPVNRRSFLASTTAGAAAPLLTSRSTVGTTDAERVRSKLDVLNALDDQTGGTTNLEDSALAAAKQALALQNGAATQRVRNRLFGLAADLTATAAWVALDARQLARARAHLDQALSLAGMAQDSVTQFRVWNTLSMLGYNNRHYSEALAAAQAAQRVGITRRDPLFASLAHARTAIAHAVVGQKQPTLRNLGYAQESLGKAGSEARPSWVAFYGAAELHSLTAIAEDLLGRHEESEAASFKSLATLPQRFRRNRALVTARLALAQVHQGDIEQGCASAEQVFTLMDGGPLPGRLRSVIGDFYRDLLTAAPDARSAYEWGDRYRTEWS
ncbi:XRE family transcriptional regulator [Streptomyces sp. NPDC093221]|uniref:XRE family transcriptional regulator n=1 Tax=Streptomyces sp. NPDC093221 TaxID=3366032 RepID=UPI0037FE0926